MSDLPAQSVRMLDPVRLAELRRRASSRLTGTAAAHGSAAGAVDALSVLHTLASSPETASDALTLLHELQVHQVELDLQAHELQESRNELESALRRQIELYDLQPVGACTVDARLTLLELNRTAAEMLGIERDEACGLPLDTFFDADSAGRLRTALARVDGGAQQASCSIELHPRRGPAWTALASIGRDRLSGRYLVGLART